MEAIRLQRPAFVAPVESYLDELDQRWHNDTITIIIPEVVVGTRSSANLLHGQSACSATSTPSRAPCRQHREVPTGPAARSWWVLAVVHRAAVLSVPELWGLGREAPQEAGGQPMAG